MKMKLSDKEIVKRSPVWIALSDLFIGRVLQGSDFNYIIKILKESQYSIAELESIFLNEVSPVFRFNIYSIPEMEGWNNEAIVSEVTSYLKKEGIFDRVLKREWFNKILLPNVSKKRWNIIKKYFNSVDSLAQDQLESEI